MKKTIIIFAAILALATPALAGVNIEHQLGVSTIEGGSSAHVLDVRATGMINDHFGIMAGGLVAGKSYKNDNTTVQHHGIFTGLTVAANTMSVSAGGIYLETTTTQTYKGFGFPTLPPSNGVNLADMSNYSTRPFCALNYKKRFPASLTINAGLMTYEIGNDLVVNAGFGAVWEF